MILTDRPSNVINYIGRYKSEVVILNIQSSSIFWRCIVDSLSHPEQSKSIPCLINFLAFQRIQTLKGSWTHLCPPLLILIYQTCYLRLRCSAAQTQTNAPAVYSEQVEYTAGGMTLNASLTTYFLCYSEILALPPCAAFRKTSIIVHFSQTYCTSL